MSKNLLCIFIIIITIIILIIILNKEAYSELCQKSTMEFFCQNSWKNSHKKVWQGPKCASGLPWSGSKSSRMKHVKFVNGNL